MAGVVLLSRSIRPCESMHRNVRTFSQKVIASIVYDSRCGMSDVAFRTYFTNWWAFLLQMLMLTTDENKLRVLRKVSFLQAHLIKSNASCCLTALQQLQVKIAWMLKKNHSLYVAGHAQELIFVFQSTGHVFQLFCWIDFVQIIGYGSHFPLLANFEHWYRLWTGIVEWFTAATKMYNSKSSSSSSIFWTIRQPPKIISLPTTSHQEHFALCLLKVIKLLEWSNHPIEQSSRSSMCLSEQQPNLN